ncbi:hypothetical protein HOLDEFILI_03849 [Holdemania filiformis DSM 12042]|uniref:Uncharacterized protein n=1 Tax=Holdemania filiformis DSM 12042 TaxID=545696 RepID=B9YDD3_9FIRM|nr:hypothetical protein HOLDEFILI_03849 [Holdemania filiformis DSM 12042]
MTDQMSDKPSRQKRDNDIIKTFPPLAATIQPNKNSQREIGFQNIQDTVNITGLLGSHAEYIPTVIDDDQKEWPSPATPKGTGAQRCQIIQNPQHFTKCKKQ